MFEREKRRKLASIKLYIVNATVCLGDIDDIGALRLLLQPITIATLTSASLADI